MIEHGRKDQGLGLDVGDLTQKNFTRLGMSRTSLVWQYRARRGNVADGWNDQGQLQAHSNRSKVRAAGSMNTTIADMSKFTAAATCNRPDVRFSLCPRRHSQLLHITTRNQFPTLLPDLPVNEQRYQDAGLGVVVFDGPEGPGFYKGGHDGQTANTMVCIERGQRCALISFE